jgi:hypothetical protein
VSLHEPRYVPGANPDEQIRATCPCEQGDDAGVLDAMSGDSVVAPRRYPLKGMIGGELNEMTGGERGVLGGRGYAITDRESGEAGSAKHPKQSPRLVGCRASLIEQPRIGEAFPPMLDIAGGRKSS